MVKRSYTMAFDALYKPLDPAKSEIRLVQLLPGKTHEPIRCAMRTVGLETKGLSFNALSYEWGSPKSQHEIMIDGIPWRIRDNLWNALHQFRSLRFYEPFWIDAICVNQADILERNSQVKLMHKIYSEANQVRIWLGKEGEQSGKAFALMGRIFKFIQDVLHKQMDSRNLTRLTPEQMLIQDLLPAEQRGGLEQTVDVYNFLSHASGAEGSCNYCAQGQRSSDACKLSHLKARWQDILCRSDEDWEALSCLLNRTYWSRVWIVQEYVLARQRVIHCGEAIIRSTTEGHGGYTQIDTLSTEVALSHILSLDLSRHTDIPSHVCKSISTIQTSPGTLIMKYATPWLSERRSLLELLTACKNSQATEPRDKIYAMLGLAWDIWDLEVDFNYAKSISEIKLDMLGWYIGPNADSRQQLWEVLNEMIPEDLDARVRDEFEKRAQDIIKEVLPIHPHVCDVQQYLEDFDVVFNSLSLSKQHLGTLRSGLETCLASSTSVR